MPTCWFTDPVELAIFRSQVQTRPRMGRPCLPSDSRRSPSRHAVARECRWNATTSLDPAFWQSVTLGPHISTRDDHWFESNVRTRFNLSDPLLQSVENPSNHSRVIGGRLEPRQFANHFLILRNDRFIRQLFASRFGGGGSARGVDSFGCRFDRFASLFDRPITNSVGLLYELGSCVTHGFRVSRTQVTASPASPACQERRPAENDKGNPRHSLCTGDRRVVDISASKLDNTSIAERVSFVNPLR